MPLPEVVDQDVVAFYNELLQEGGLSDEETKLLESIVGKEKVWKKFKSGLHARSRFDQEMDKTKKEQKRLEEDYSKKVAELDSLRETITTGTDLTKKEREALIAKANALEDKIHKAIQKAKEFQDGDTVIKELGLDGTITYTPPSPEPTRKSDSPSFDEESFTKKLTSQMNTNARALAKWSVDLRKMEREYYSLTGKELDPEELFTKLTEKVDDYGGNYYKVFEDEYDIVNLRTKRQEESIREKVRKEMEAEFERKLSEKLLPQERRSMNESDFYKSIDASIPEEEKKSATSGMGIDNRSEVVGEAAAFMQKLREKKEATA